MDLYVFILIVLSIVINVCQAKFSPYIVNGHFADIKEFPHSALMFVTCFKENEKTHKAWKCGASVLNQKIILTAAHCLENCLLTSEIVIMFGNTERNQNLAVSATTFKIHEQYNTFTIANDVALVMMKNPLKLNQKVSRVAIMRNPPYNEVAIVAGWGFTQENLASDRLKQAKQVIFSMQKCMSLFGARPGFLCADEIDSDGYAAQGDSGSALVVRKYIQVGIVSFKKPALSRSIVVYSDVGYFYDWIETNSKLLYCNYKK